jgi:hypothetical protein
LYSRSYTIAILVLSLIGTLSFNDILLHRASGLSYDYAPSFEVTELGLFDAKGERVRDTLIAQQVSMRVTIVNNGDTEQQYMVLTEMRDGFGITIYLTWQSGILKAGENYTFETSWIVDTACKIHSQGCNTYEVRSFVITDIQSPRVLSDVKAIGGSVIETTEEGNRLYRLELDGKLYEIEYSLDAGSIGLIQVDRERSLVHLTLRDVDERSQLSLKGSNDFLMDILSCGLEPTSNILDKGVEAFVDGVSYGVIHANQGEWKLELKSGSKEVAFAGACLVNG